MPAAVTPDFDAPTDARLRQLRSELDDAETVLADARRQMAQAIRSATGNGVSMVHVAETVGWSRQWCYNAMERWLDG